MPPHEMCAVAARASLADGALVLTVARTWAPAPPPLAALAIDMPRHAPGLGRHWPS
jgi:hypothetical protein